MDNSQKKVMDSINYNLPLYKNMTTRIIEDCSEIRKIYFKDLILNRMAKIDSIKELGHAAKIMYGLKKLPTPCYSVFKAMFKDSGACEIVDIDCVVDPNGQRRYDELKESCIGESLAPVVEL